MRTPQKTVTLADLFIELRKLGNLKELSKIRLDFRGTCREPMIALIGQFEVKRAAK